MKELSHRFILFSSLLFLAFFFFTVSTATANTAQADFEDLIRADAPVAITYMISMLIMKITAFVFGYLIVKLGHDTLIKGVTGEFDFGFEGSGIKTKMKSAAPGVFFVLAGSAIIMWAIFVKKPYEFEIKPSQEIHNATVQQSHLDAADTIPAFPD